MQTFSCTVSTDVLQFLLVIRGAIDFMCSIMTAGLAPLGRPGCFEAFVGCPPLSLALK